MKLTLTDTEPEQAPRHHVDIEIQENGRGKVVVDGVDLSDAISALRISSNADAGVLVVITIAATVSVQGPTRLLIPESTMVALEQLGWTRPSEEEHPEGLHR